FTYPQIGNYGVSADAMESDQIHARAAIMRAAVDRDDAPGAESGWLTWLARHRLPAITELDTRALVRHIRDRGAMRGGLFPASVAQPAARELVAAEPPMTGRDLAGTVTPRAPITLDGDGGPRIAVIDTGVKSSIIHNLRARGATVELHPCSATAAQLLSGDPDAIFLANGPGDPAALDYITDTVRQLVGKRPVYGICLGHQLLCRAVGLQTYKLPFGHHGANHPVKDLTTGKTEITSQNHGFAVLGPDGAKTIDTDAPVRWETDFGAAELTHINLYDRTVEGLQLKDVRGATVQYHPEAGPGPHDSLYLFDRFVDEIKRAA
ncbi:MAG: glutamine-hydrolyzing carbamoyl-phosphate synthase small subunit, partial [Solirubrobacteraceae bacterium]